MAILKFEIGPLSTNCYLFVDDKTNEAVVIDPAFETEKLEKQLKEEWVNSVKQTSKKVVKRLLKHDKELADDYFGVLVEDLQDRNKIF